MKDQFEFYERRKKLHITQYTIFLHEKRLQRRKTIDLATDKILEENECIAEDLPQAQDGEPLPNDEFVGRFDMILEKETFKFFN